MGNPLYNWNYMLDNESVHATSWNNTQSMIKMKLRLNIFHEIEIQRPSIAKSIVSCENSKVENNN